MFFEALECSEEAFDDGVLRKNSFREVGRGLQVVFRDLLHAHLKVRAALGVQTLRNASMPGSGTTRFLPAYQQADEPRG
jgi:hypothetical protein